MRLDLGAGATEPTVVADAERLEHMAVAWLANLARVDTAGARASTPELITIRFVARVASHRALEAPRACAEPPTASSSTHVTEFRAFNPSSRNLFVLQLSPVVVRRAGERAARAACARRLAA